MTLFVADNGDTTIQVVSAADLSGWSARLSIITGMAVEFQQELVGGEASFTVPPSLIGRRYELSAIGPDLEPQPFASGLIVLDPTPEPNVYTFEPEVEGEPFSDYVHDQDVPATTWTIVHGLGRWPSVTVVDSAGTEVQGGVTYIDDNTIELEFSAAFGGRAFIGG